MQSKIKQILVLVALVSVCFGMYEHQVGQFDWNIKTIGELKEIQIEQSNIYFQSQQNMFGNLKTSTGEIIWSSGRSEQQKQHKLLWNKNSHLSQNKFQSILTSQESLQVYNFQKNQFSQLFSSQMESDPIDYLYLNQNTILFLTETSVQVSKEEKEREELTLREVVSISNNEKFCALASYNEDIYIVGHQNNNICLYKLQQNKLNSSNLSSSTLQKECVVFTSSFDINNIVVAKEFVYYKGIVPIIFDLKSGKQVDVSEFQNHLFEIEPSQNLLLSRMGISYNFFQIKNKKLHLVYTVSNHDGKQIAPAKVNDYNNESTQSIYYFENEPTGFATLYKVVEKKPVKVFKWLQECAVKNIWVKNIGNESLILFQNFDLKTSFFSSKQQDVKWVREESLAYIKDLKFIDFTHAKERHVSSYHELLDEKGNFNTLYVLPQFLLRIKDEFEDLVKSVLDQSVYIQEVAQGLVKVRSLQDFKDLNNIGKDNRDYNIFYGIKKFILFVSEYQTVFRFESDNGNLVWRKNISDVVDSTYSLMGIYDLQERQGELIHNEVLIVYHSQQKKNIKILQVDPQDGSMKVVQEFQLENPLKILKIQKDQNDFILILDQQYKGYQYPSKQDNRILEEKSDNILFYRFNQEANSIEGYRFYGQKVEQIWNINFSEQEVLIQIDSSYTEGASPRIALFDEHKVIFKHINYSNFAIITKNKGQGIQQGQGILNLYIVNAKTGRVLFNHNQQLVDLSQPINMIYDENAVFVSYFNPQQFLYEIWVVEAYSKEIITSFYNILEDYYFSPKQTGEDFNYTEEDLDIIFLEQKYGFLQGIKSLSVIETKLSLTKRNLAIITSQNQVYSLDRHLVSARRSVKTKIANDLNKVMSLESLNLTPYTYLLPLNFQNTLTYFQNLNGLQNIQFAPTNFESTTLFIAYGGDIFCGKVAPEKTFDILSEDFNYVALILTTIIVVYMVIIIKKFAARSQIFKLFHK